jgi:glucose-1-phosphate thymidylyltransferase
MKGIILAGGAGTRLHPVTLAVSKQLIAGLRQADDLLSADHADARRVRDILLITTPQDLPNYVKVLGDGSASGAFR